ncbi:polysaccharide biosynthesis tyrosine autokinase [Paenibacillus sp. LMG 31456]|uniref:non-specific protein-tyrosine kinase n=1 Tax=Paenibacillus foliorum TaxID=2654974 RepID=A0A972GWD6_9BACL|nr:CpsD/CapB family tyrosine-protein kinase [Paenibacillus foliorum]NOU97355.1 polysaccharide biosynthesis tyrosine autokinase [Paenibacillus foliorum]
MPRQIANSDIMIIDPDSPTFEAYRTLRTNIEFSAFDRVVKTITITSANQGEGRTSTALNLAVAYAQAGKKVMLVDADLRKPSLHHAFNLDNTRGLTNFLANQIAINEIIRETPVDNLSLIVSGHIPPNPSELLASERLRTLLVELKQNYDIILFDTSPALTLTDAKIMAATCDGVLLVVEYGKIKRDVAKKIKDDLTHVKANLLGVVLNKLNSKDAAAYLY